MKIEFGDKVQDSITGFVGTVTGRTEYITGCDQYLVQPPVKADSGDFVEARWIDVDRLEVVEAKKKKFAVTRAGADKPAPVK